MQVNKTATVMSENEIYIDGWYDAYDAVPRHIITKFSNLLFFSLKHERDERDELRAATGGSFS